MKPYTDSPQYDEFRNRFEHPAGYRNDKDRSTCSALPVPS